MDDIEETRGMVVIWPFLKPNHPNLVFLRWFARKMICPFLKLEEKPVLEKSEQNLKFLI